MKNLLLFLSVLLFSLSSYSQVRPILIEHAEKQAWFIAKMENKTYFDSYVFSLVVEASNQNLHKGVLLDFIKNYNFKKNPNIHSLIINGYKEYIYLKGDDEVVKREARELNKTKVFRKFISEAENF